MKKIMEEITFLGGIMFYFLFLIWFLFKKEYNLFFILVFGLIIIYFITLIIRIFYFKSRPEKRKYRNFIEKIDASSFPSVHSARAAFLFIFLSIIFLKNFILISISFILLILVFYSRIYLKKHDLVDILGGILLGIFTFLVLFLI